MPPAESTLWASAKKAAACSSCQTQMRGMPHNNHDFLVWQGISSQLAAVSSQPKYCSGRFAGFFPPDLSRQVVYVDPQDRGFKQGIGGLFFAPLDMLLVAVVIFFHQGN